MPISITGMHRSGTSIVARLLHLCGLYLGQEGDLMPPGAGNPGGHWEHVKFVELNDEILHELGGGWDYPPPVPDRWDEKDRKRFPHLMVKAGIILQEFLDNEPWGWKDPRNSLTLPFWINLLPDLKIVICLRNPLEVALSLHRRNYLSYSLGLTLWKIYNQRILDSTLPEQRIITHYEAYFHDPQTELRRVLSFLDMPVSEEVIEQCCLAIKTDLRHNRFSTQHLLDGDVSPDLFNLYIQMCAQAVWPRDGKGIQEPFSGDREGGGSETKEGEPYLDKSVIEVELLRQELKALQSELAVRDATIGELQSLLEEQATLAQRTAGEIAQREATIDELQGLLEQSQQERETLWQTVEEQMKYLEALLVRFELMSSRTDNLRTMLLDVRDQLLLPHEDEGQATNRELREPIATQDLVAGPDIAHRRLAQRIREVVRTTLPGDATVIVANKGDNELLKLDDRPAQPFPQTMDGLYADHYPTDGSAIIAHLETLRSKGSNFLLFPSTALAWLNHYGKFKQYLEHRYQVVVRQEDTCLIFALHQPAVSKNGAWWAEFEEIITEFQGRFGREPAILDWNTGLELAARFPQYTIFSPPTTDRILPYLDHSLDIVAVASPDLAAKAEAHRAAEAAVINFTQTETGPENDLPLTVEWMLAGTVTKPPTTSIIIPVYSGLAYTKACLTALRETLPRNYSGEIIVVDDGSTDETPVWLEQLAKQEKRLKIVRHQENAGFITSCNRGARAATGEIIIFLNNDTLALPGWLEPLWRIFRDHPDAGAVGGKLIYPDGRLQEAGCIIFSEGSGANFGKGDYQVDDPLYNYVREVDYCSGALLATKRALFIESGGFDTTYSPAYYEDADYCFRLREKGYRVYYQPESNIVHFEGSTAGTDLSGGVKRYQAVNQANFVQKWSHTLQRQPSPPTQFDLTTWHTLAVRDDLGESENQ